MVHHDVTLGVPMYKLVIVEDERDVRRRLVSYVEKVKTKFDLVAEYENGIDAYEGILTDSPDLVITDIRIPYIDGIELSKKIREVLPLVKIIIITGYSKFDYAKEAANLGVVGFISKPVTQADVKTLLQKSEEELDREFLTTSNLNQLEEFYENSLPIIREYDLFRLSTMSEIPKYFMKKLSMSNVDLNYKYFALCVFDFDESADRDVEKHELAFSFVRKQVQQSFSEEYSIEMFNRSEKVCMILKSNEELDITKIERLMEKIIIRVGRFSGMSLNAGISNVYDGVLDFAGMYNEAMHALEYRSVIGGGKVFAFGNSSPDAAGKLPSDDADIRTLGYFIRFKPIDTSIEHLGYLQQKLESDESQSSMYFITTTILNTLLKACNDLEGLYGEYSGQRGIYRRMLERKTIPEVFGYLEEVARFIHKLNDSFIVEKMESNMQKIIMYMESHYRDADISLELLAREVNFSVSYISMLLKKSANTSFTKYITSLRMETAKELLADQNMKIIDVAEDLGYADPYYFSHCFKKYTGLSPKEFRLHE